MLLGLDCLGLVGLRLAPVGIHPFRLLNHFILLILFIIVVIIIVISYCYVDLMVVITFILYIMMIDYFDYD
jgi:hypothetical protein